MAATPVSLPQKNTFAAPLTEKNEKELGDDFMKDRIVIRNPLQIYSIIENIYRFLSLKNIKSCRLINQQWNFVAEPLLRKRAKIHFRRCNNRPQYLEGLPFRRNIGQKCIDNFNEDFSASSSSQPFTAFKFSGDAWRVSEFLAFCGKNRETIKDWQLSCIMLENKHRTKLNIFDISPWFFGSQLTKLKLDCSGIVFDPQNATRLKVCLRNVGSTVKNLVLDGCLVDVSDMDTRLQPKRITWSNVTIYAKEALGKYRLNDAIDFSKTEEIFLRYPYNRNSWTAPTPTTRDQIFDLSELTIVERLSLFRYPVQNWAESKCIVNKLGGISDYIFTKTEMTIRELTLSYVPLSLDCSILPNTLEKLYFNNHVIITSFSYPDKFNLPNLEFLSLDTFDTPQIVKCFTNCINLTEMEIGCENHVYDRKTLDLDYFPRGIKKLKLGGPGKVTGSLALETLILQGASWNNAEEILCKISARVLIIKLIPSIENPDNITNLLKSRHLSSFVGEFEWIGQMDFKRLAIYVDRKAKYYCFENQKGRAIEKREFSNLAALPSE